MRQLTIFKNGGYSLMNHMPGRGWDSECMVLHALPEHRTEEMVAWAQSQRIEVVDTRQAIGAAA